MSKAKEMVKTGLREMRGDALWDMVKVLFSLATEHIGTLAFALSSLGAIGVGVFRWFQGMPRHLLLQLGIFLGLLVLFTVARIIRKHKKGKAKSPSPIAKMEGTPETTSQLTTTVDTPQIPLHLLEQYFEIKKLEPNLVYLSVENLAAHKDENSVIVIGEANQSENFRAVVIPFHNNEEIRGRIEAKRKIGKVENVSAQITYRYFNRNNSLRIKRGAWLSEKESRVNFGVNDIRRLIVAIVEEKDAPHVYAVHRDFDSTYKGNITMREELQGDLIALSVRLIAEAESREINTFEFMLEIVREPRFEVKLQKAFIWKYDRLRNFESEGIRLSIRIYEGEKAEQIIEEVKDWEMRTATFLGQHFGEQQKASLLRAHPSLEQGLRGDFRLRLPTLIKDGRKEPFVPSSWTLNDSIEARTKILEECIKRL